MISGDTRLEELGISERLQQECNAVVWDPAKGAENISQAEQAKVGVVYAEYWFNRIREAWFFFPPPSAGVH